ncbi:hypothetical protein GCM10010441_75560 [Kitasatospora paracochleata]|uniref:Uncharacterized protein n=1 Tax=Kitasatospora paracochleata TaxID=58354 RepID=A0ABT1JAN5_9ACTN|nr:hypothetical protein [Kitasatospora paracochleata]MCP2314269.1 hypothetical protein [Kitasatospora paracochleata]
MSMWWVGRRDALLADVAGALVFFGADPVDDPGIGELADTARALAAQYRTSGRSRAAREAGSLLDEAAAELACADRFRGALLPVVTRRLRRAALALGQARTLLRLLAARAGEEPTGAEPAAIRAAMR